MPETSNILQFPKPTKPKKWARSFDACQRCGTTQRKHKSRGYCAPCWEAADRELKIPGTWRWRDAQEVDEDWRAMKEWESIQFDYDPVMREYVSWHLSIGHGSRTAQLSDFPRPEGVS